MVITRRYSFWLIFSILSGISGFLSYKYLDTAIPFVQVAITADRNDVMQSSLDLVSDIGFNAANYSNAVKFETDHILQSFVELEGGGKKAFLKMFQGSAHCPYQWAVRFFKEKEVEEVTIWYTPQGEKWGYCRKISEEQVGAALSKDKALILAENVAKKWSENFDNYHVVEYDAETQKTGRVDHVFMYERSDINLGKGLYRLKVAVLGDQVTTFKPFIKVPDNFLRRYQQMRSDNNLLGWFGHFFFKVFYLLLLGLFGFLTLYRYRFMLPGPSCIAAFIVAGFGFLGGLNDYPLWWSSYNTIQSSTSFISMMMVMQLLSFLAFFGILFYALAVAEGAGRFVFKNHVQFWKLTNLKALSSYEVVSQVLIGYLATTFMFGFVVSFYYVTQNYLDWWVPLESLSDPNVLASYFPWLGVIAKSLGAGFGEEVMFRAFPIAIVLLLTRNSSNKGFWFGFIFLLQILIFGSCHAMYPNQPFYARVVELIIPSTGFGLLYCWFGLLPGIIMHFTYDALLFAIPVFVSQLIVSKIIVLLFIGLPLWVVLFAWFKAGRLEALPQSFFNKSFVSPGEIKFEAKKRLFADLLPSKNKTVVMVLGLVGLGLWVTTKRFSFDTQSLTITQEAAIKKSTKILEERFSVDLKDWKAVCNVQNNSATTESRFVWQTFGEQVYQKLQGSYIHDPSWIVKFVKFHGEVEERAEAFITMLDGSGNLISFCHKTPEHYKGEDLSQEKSHLLVDDFIVNELCFAQNDYKILSFDSEKHENRRDWKFVIQDLSNSKIVAPAQARIEINISGDEISSYDRFIYPPEAWSRSDQAFIMNIKICKYGLNFFMYLFLSFGLMFGLRRLWAVSVAHNIVLRLGAFVFMFLLIGAINNIPITVTTFNTVEPFYNQVCMTLLTNVMGILWLVLIYALLLSIGCLGFARSRQSNMSLDEILLAKGAGIFCAGSVALISFFYKATDPYTTVFNEAYSWSPIIGLVISTMQSFCMAFTLFTALFLSLEFLESKWQNNHLLKLLCSILFCLSFGGSSMINSFELLFAQGAVMGIAVYLVYWLLLRFNMSLLPIMVSTMLALKIMPVLIAAPFVGAFVGGIVTLLSLAVVSFFFFQIAQSE